MAFKSFDKYVADKNGSFFLLPNDKDYADVIFLYRNVQDVLVADTHYVKSPDYSGYVHCCGRGCPACGKGIRVQTKIFIPLFNYRTSKIEFWDRSNHFERQLQSDILSKFPNPYEWVFRITRNGAAGDVNTTYSIVPQGKNSSYPYEKILADHGIQLPDGYSAVCRDCTPSELNEMLNANVSVPTSDYNYVPTPRASSNDYQPISTSIPEPISVQPPVFGNVPEGISDVPGVSEFPPFEGGQVVTSTDTSSSDSDMTDDLGDVNF